MVQEAAARSVRRQIRNAKVASRIDAAPADAARLAHPDFVDFDIE